MNPPSESPVPTFVPDGTRVLPNVWPGDPLPVQPGDVTQFVPLGFALGGPLIVRPWDTLEDAMAAGDYYGAQPQTFHPLHGAPRTDACGGTIYFDTGNSRESLLAAFSVMGVNPHPGRREYAVFCDESEDALKEGFISHCRIMPYSTLASLFGARLDLVDACKSPQPVSVQDLLCHFVTAEEKRWGTGMGGALSGCMGGDGDWAKESLCFGFMVENAYHFVLRIWSRAELVTK